MYLITLSYNTKQVKMLANLAKNVTYWEHRLQIMDITSLAVTILV